MNNHTIGPASVIPTKHIGADYKHFTAELSRMRGSNLYLEIGVQNGVHMSTISAESLTQKPINARVA